MSADNTTANSHIAIASPLSAASVTIAGFVFLQSGTNPDWTLFDLDNGSTEFFQISSSEAPSANFMGLWSENHAGGSAGVQFLSMATALNTWVFIALVGAGTTSTVYWSVAGGAIQSTTIETSSVAAGNLFISADGLGDGDWPGLITGVRVWSRSLTAAEVANESHRLTPAALNGLWAQYTQLNGSNLGLDYSGNGRTATVVGTPATAAQMPPAPWYRNQNVMSM